MRQSSGPSVVPVPRPTMKPLQTKVSSRIDRETVAAESYCALVDLEWPSMESIIWFESPAYQEVGWRLSRKRSPPAVDEEIGALLSKAFFLGCLRDRLLTLSEECGRRYSPPTSEPATAWPGRVNHVKRLHIAPSSSAKEATVKFIQVVKTLWRDESLVVCGFPFNDFCVNVLYAFGHLFKNVGLVCPNSKCTTVLFYSFRQWELAYEQILSNLSLPENQDLQDMGIYLISDKKNLHDIVLGMKEPKTFKAKKHDMAYEHRSHGTCCLDCDSKRQLKEQSKSPDMSSSASFASEGDNDKWFSFSKTCPRLEVIKKSSRYSSFSYIEVTKFCSKELLSDWEELSIKMKHALKLTEESLREGSCLGIDSNLIATATKQYSWAPRKLDVKLLDFGMELWFNIEKHVNHRRQILQLISNVLENSKECECLEIRGFPLLSEFSVSLIYILSHLFEKVRLYHTSVGRNVIFFFNLRSFPAALKKGMKDLIKDSHCVTSLVPLKHLFSGVFYEKIQKFNNLSLKRQTLYISNFISLHGK